MDPEDTETTRSEGPPTTPELRIGPYKVVRELGHGGMGAVYLAARADEQYQKRVAIKVIKTGAGGEEVRHFRRERQILASLDHPHIARLLDGGATEDGSPYLVMEYIQGQPIGEYCDRRRLPTVERLKLFQGVCSALAYAHRNLIVHRDIKPSNILVTAEGVPRLLDFGIAKFLNPELSWEAPTGTHFALTPDYASPEQVRGEPLTTATDVYSLGVLLFELLTGHRPYRLKSRQTLEVLRAVCEEEPEKPSTAIGRTVEVLESSGQTTVTAERVSETRDGTPEKLRRRLRGDLDTILLTALRKEPHLRYPSVEAFSADIKRHLEGHPISARGASAAYRTGKFIRRHVVGVAAASVIALLVIGFAVSVAVQSVRLARERDKAERVSSFLVDLFKVSDPGEARGNTITARELLDKGAARIQGELGEQPEVKASFLGTMGRVYSSLGLYDKAQPLLEEALQIRRRALGREHREVAESSHDLATLLQYKGDYAGAESLHREALAIRRKLFGSEHLDVARSMNNLGNVLNERADHAGAESLHRQALAMRRKLLGNEHADVARSLSNLAMVLYRKGEYAGMESLYREALAMRRKLLGNEHPDVAGNLNNLANALFIKGDYAGAEPVYREALALYQKLLGNEHPDVARGLTNLAIVLYIKGDYAGAEPLYREALVMRQKLLGNEHPEVAGGLNALAQLLRDKGDYAGAERLHREALATRRKLLGREHPDTAESLGNLGSVLAEKGDYAGAEALLRESLAILGKRLPQGHLYAVWSLNSLVDVLREKGDHAGAEGLGREALAMSRRLLGNGHPDVARSLSGLGAVLRERGDLRAAEALFREALAIMQQGLPRGHPDIAETESGLGGCLVALHRYDEAEPMLLRSYPVLESSHGPHSRVSRKALERVVSLYETWGKREEAARYRQLRPRPH